MPSFSVLTMCHPVPSSMWPGFGHRHHHLKGFQTHTRARMRRKIDCCTLQETMQARNATRCDVPTRTNTIVCMRVRTRKAHRYTCGGRHFGPSFALLPFRSLAPPRFLLTTLAHPDDGRLDGRTAKYPKKSSAYVVPNSGQRPSSLWKYSLPY